VRTHFGQDTKYESDGRKGNDIGRQQKMNKVKESRNVIADSQETK
jgi:hypothetical protein